MNNMRLILGLILILVGINIFFDQIGFSSFWFGDIFGTFWPLILIAAGVSALSKRNTIVCLLLVGMGTLFQLTELFNINFSQLLWPLLLIGAGLLVLFRDQFPYSNGVVTGPDQRDSFDESVMFSGLEKKVLSKSFTGGRISCFFAGVEIDLTEAVISPEGAILEVTCGFGGVEIYVSSTTRVQSQGDPILAGWSFEPSVTDSTGPLLTIKGTAVFGGVEIKQK